MAWAMRQIYLHPALNASTLSPDAAWDAHDVVQIAPVELSNEELVRIWDRLKPTYRLSAPYVARVVRIAADESHDSLSVVTTQFGYSERNGTGQVDRPGPGGERPSPPLLHRPRQTPESSPVPKAPW